ncbi:MAG TPA: sarcosine oxidase subunit gamma family protein [Actinomycetota bacterium]
MTDRAELLAGIEAATNGEVRARELALLQIDLRLAQHPARNLPFAVPVDPNTFEARPQEVLWLGPDEWLLTRPADGNHDLVAELEAALAGEHHSIVDVSAARAVFELTGPGTIDLLSHGCGIDLHPRSWGEGDCAQTLLARMQVILQQRHDATRVFVRSSFADSLADWLLDAASRP